MAVAIATGRSAHCSFCDTRVTLEIGPQPYPDRDVDIIHICENCIAVFKAISDHTGGCVTDMVIEYVQQGRMRDALALVGEFLSENWWGGVCMFEENVATVVPVPVQQPNHPPTELIATTAAGTLPKLVLVRFQNLCWSTPCLCGRVINFVGRIGGGESVECEACHVKVMCCFSCGKFFMYHITAATGCPNCGFCD